MRAIVKVLAKVASSFHALEQRLKVILTHKLNTHHSRPLLAIGLLAVLEVGDIVVRPKNVLYEVP